ncbi:MAG: DUF2807 domain-containing protein [Paramuribaculum sp.]|nr:DUF2807 domain-containing protein [Paramuribaculum sp.]
MKKLLFAVIAAIALTPASLRAQSKSYALDVHEFHELEVVDAINVDYQCNPEKAGKVEFETTPDLAPAILFEPNKGKLAIKLSSSETPYRNLPTVRVYSTYLSKVENSGDSTVRVLASAGTPEFNAKVIGNGRLVVRDVRATNVKASILTGKGTLVIYGECTRANLKSVGGSSFLQADELQAKEVKCSVTGNGTVNCYATDKLNVSGLGSGTVLYRGNPEIKKSSLSRVKIQSIDSSN